MLKLNRLLSFQPLRFFPTAVFAFTWLCYVCFFNLSQAKESSPSKAKTPNKTTSLSELFSSTAKLVPLSSISNQIAVDLHYSQLGNKYGNDLYGELEECFVAEEMALALEKAQLLLSKVRPGYSLLIYDCARTRKIQKIMDQLDKNTETSSIEAITHTHGIGVDLTIADYHLRPLDMGSGFDIDSKLSDRRLEKELVEQNILTPEQVMNRNRLAVLMRKAGLTGVENNWWHFHLPYSKEQIKQRFPLIQ